MGFFQGFVTHQDLLIYLLIPFISGFVGWATNAIGIKMMFKPENFIGIKPFLGWQGIIPARAEKFARLQMQQMEQIINIKELFARVNPEEVANVMKPGLKQLVEDIADELLTESMPIAWENTPNRIKERFYRRINAAIPAMVEDLYRDVRYNFDDFFDAKEMVIQKLANDKSILNELIQKMVHKELKFLVKSGMYFGFAFGIIQMAMCFLFPSIWWVLPAGGFCVGFLTNWIAVKMMFRPLEPVKVGPFLLQGLFLKRKNEVASDYAATMADRVINSANVAEFIMEGAASDKCYRLLERHVKESLDKTMGYGKPLVMMSLGVNNYLSVKHRVCDKIVHGSQNLPPAIKYGVLYTEEAMGLEMEIESKIQDFSHTEFERFIRPIFEQDEWILYAVGGGLGFLAGWGQLVLMFY